MAESEKTRIYEEGNNGFMIAPIQADGSYGEVIKISGLISVDITMSNTKTAIAADDVTDYIIKQSGTKGEGTITFAGLSKADYAALYDKITDSNGALTFGRRGSPKKVGFSFLNTQEYLEGSSVNKFTINNAYFSIPNLSTTTLAEDDNTIRSLALSVTCSPYTYETTDGKKDTVTWTVLNSEDNVDIWDNVKDQIYVPDKTYSSL